MRMFLIGIAIAYLLMVLLFSIFQRDLLYYPSHHTNASGLSAWRINERVIGYSRTVAAPQNVWLLLHGNGGQAADRLYALPSFSERDAVFILEYPGYGSREGAPSKQSFDSAAAEGYLLLRRTFPSTPVCVFGESIGSGPACELARQSQPPDKLVLVVPFDKLSAVASDHFPFLPARLILFDSWDNIKALSGYKRPVEIYGATDDSIIGIGHARALAVSLASATFHPIPGEHNDWQAGGGVNARNP